MRTLDVCEVRDASGFRALEGAWRALYDRLPLASPFQSWEWAQAWWRHLGRGVPFILTAHAGGRLVGLLALNLRRYRGLPLRRLTFLGAPEADYQDLLAEPAHAETCAGAFLAHLQRAREAWDILDLPDVPEQSPLVRVPREPGMRLLIAQHRVCPYLPLPGTWDALKGRLSKNLRSAIERKLRKLERDHEAAFERVSGERVLPALESLFELHDHRWQERGLSGAFHDERVRAFHRELAPLLDRAGVLRLHRLAAYDSTYAVFYCFARGERVYYYLSGFSTVLERYSPGQLTLQHAIRSAIGEGAREFDFLRGDENYKYAWRAEDRRTVRVVGGKAGLRAQVALSVNRAERSLEKLASRLRNRLWGHHPRQGLR